MRDTKQDALVGITAGSVGGIANAILTHPFDNYITKKVTGKLLPSDKLWKAPLQKRMWEGVTTAAFKKGLGFGIGLGVSFGVSSGIKNFMENRKNLKALKFHKSS